MRETEDDLPGAASRSAGSSEQVVFICNRSK
jgi:hypothetical protein